MKYLDIIEAKKFIKGKNIIISSKYNLSANDSQIIEIAYDLQAGSYIEYLKSNRESGFVFKNLEYQQQHIKSGDSL